MQRTILDGILNELSTIKATERLEYNISRALMQILISQNWTKNTPQVVQLLVKITWILLNFAQVMELSLGL